jgi:hypothetical protein
MIGFCQRSTAHLTMNPFPLLRAEDLDDTLYPGSTGIGPELKRNIDEFLMARFGLAAERAAALRVELFRSHGSTLAGLIVSATQIRFLNPSIPFPSIPDMRIILRPAGARPRRAPRRVPQVSTQATPAFLLLVKLIGDHASKI